jgi:hypothetical protein
LWECGNCSVCFPQFSKQWGPLAAAGRLQNFLTQFHATHEIYRRETPAASAWKYSTRISVTINLTEICVGFEVLTAVTMRISIFWVVTPCSLVELRRGFGATYRLHLQRRRVCLFSYLTWLTFDPENGAVCSPETSVHPTAL